MNFKIIALSTVHYHIGTGMALGKFCANLTFMFNEYPFVERYMSAKTAGFKAVESGFPYGVDPQLIYDAKNASGVHQVLVNIYTGDVSKGELGFAAIPGKEKEFRESLLKTVEFAKQMNIPKIHLMSGKCETLNKENDEVFTSNLQYAVKLLEKENIIGLIEPINRYAIPNYYMNSYDKAIQYIKHFNNPHLRLMLDFYHAQHICGDLTHLIKDTFPYIGHVQIAQVPHRNEPDTLGEINYKYVFNQLHNIGYADWIGLEYFPAEKTLNGLKWIHESGFKLQ